MYANYVNPWGRDAPWYGCMWKDQSLCKPIPATSAGIFTQTNRLFIRDAAANIVEVFKAVE
jgi:hypothetical protein